MLDQLETIATGLDHPEGVAWGPDGRVYAGGEAGQVYSIGADGAAVEIASTAFIGANLDRLAISSLGGWNLVTLDVGITGLPLRYPRPG